ncbi:TPA: hypothetical protein EYM26_01795 [Candidatus Poribacteria bacterium]|nr:hypothetical protein [Candidatus Poribacteria bacterium]
MSEKLSGPNADVLEAQARVCTGPHQTRPLGVKETDSIRPETILEIILKSAKGELSRDQMVSKAQMGAFFAAMTIRKNFPPDTRWSQVEIDAFNKYSPDLAKLMPPEIEFLRYPDMAYCPSTPEEGIVVGALKKILKSEHLTYCETLKVCKAILTNRVKDALKAATLIGQRMNLESYDEVLGFLDAVFAPDQVESVSVDSLTHFGEPFDGATRYFRPTLFIAAVRASMGHASVLYGVDEMPPKNGVTEEKILRILGANTNLSLDSAATLIEDSTVGFAYISQREYAPGAYAIRQLRHHIKKRPPWAATEKAQQLFSASKMNCMVIGYYHLGYEKKLLQLMWDRGFQVGLAIKGEEGTSHYALRLSSPSTLDRQAVNYSQGFQRVNDQREDFSLDLDPQNFGFNYQKNPRLKIVSPKSFATAGMSALSGQKGHVYDRLVLNTAMTDYLLGFYSDPDLAVKSVKRAIDSGQALSHLKTYIAKSQTM